MGSRVRKPSEWPSELRSESTTATITGARQSQATSSRHAKRRALRSNHATYSTKAPRRARATASEAEK